MLAREVFFLFGAARLLPLRRLRRRARGWRACRFLATAGVSATMDWLISSHSCPVPPQGSLIQYVSL